MTLAVPRRQVRRRGDDGGGQPRRRAEDRLPDRGRPGRVCLRGGFPQPAGRPSGQSDAAGEAGSLRPRPGEVSAGRPLGTRRQTPPSPWSPTASAAGGSSRRTRPSLPSGGSSSSNARPRTPTPPSGPRSSGAPSSSCWASGSRSWRASSSPGEWSRRSGCSRKARRGSAPATLDQPIELHTGDEIEALAGSFNRMTASLKESHAGPGAEGGGAHAGAGRRQPRPDRGAGAADGDERDPARDQPVADRHPARASTRGGSAARLCGAYRRRSSSAAMANSSASSAHHGADSPRPIGAFSVPLVRGMVAGRAMLERRTVHVADLQDERGRVSRGQRVCAAAGASGRP